MGNIFRRDFSLGWFPSADAVNAPPTALLRADNLILDDDGVVALRQGSAKVNSSAFTDLDVHSLYTAHISGTRYRMSGAGSSVYANGTAIPGVTFNGDGDISFNSQFNQIFMARSSTKKKYDGTYTRNWGIEPPSVAPTITAASTFQATFASFDSTESPAFTANEGTITGTFPTGADGTANGSLELTPSVTTGRGTVTKIYAADSDYSTISGFPEDPNDVVDMSVWVSEPEKVESITIMVGITNDATDPFKTDYFYMEYPLARPVAFVVSPVPGIQDQVRRKNKNRGAQDDDIVRGGPAGGPVDSGFTDDVPERETPEDILERIRQRIEDRRRARADRATNPGWTVLSATRGQFARVGATTGRGWNTVRGFKVVYKAQVGATGAVRFDSAIILGGADSRALLGTFKFRYILVRATDVFVEKSEASPASAEIILHTQPVQITIPAAAVAAADSQVNQIWVYFTNEYLDAWYRVPLPSSTLTGSRVRLDEFARLADSSYDATDRTRLNLFEFSIPLLGSGGAITVDLPVNVTDALILNETLDFDIRTPPDNIVGIEGLYFDRLFALTAERLYPSRRRAPGNYSRAEVIRVGDASETAYWVKKTIGGLYVGTSRDIYLIRGTGDENPDGTIDFQKVPMSVDKPPVSAAAAVNGPEIVYLAADGWRIFNGVTSRPVPRDAVDLLYRGYTRHGVSSVNLPTATNGARFSAAVSKGVLVALTPEGASTTSSTILHRHNFQRQRWYRHTYTPSYRVVYAEPDGTILAGDTAGFVRQIDTGTQDDSVDIPVVAWTKVDDDSKPLQRKDAFDLNVKVDTGGNTATAALHLDNSGSASLSPTASSSGMGLHKADVSALAAFRQIQLRLTGSFSAFKLYEFNVSYRQRPQTRMFVDTGYFPLAVRRVWPRRLLINANSPNDLTVKTYMDGTLVNTQTITVTANVTKEYPLWLGRDISGTQARVTIASTNSAGTGEVGFECYSVEVLLSPRGNSSQKPKVRIFPEQVAV